jgi:hypothetical protein
MTEEFELALIEMGLLEPERAAEKDRADDRALEALVGDRVLDVAQEEQGQGEEREEAAAPDVGVEPHGASPVADPALPVGAPAETAAQEERVAAQAAGEVQDMISLLAAGVDIGDAPASALRNRLRRSFAERIQQKLAGLAEPVPAIQKRSYRKRTSSAH